MYTKSILVTKINEADKQKHTRCADEPSGHSETNPSYNTWS